MDRARASRGASLCVLATDRTAPAARACPLSPFPLACLPTLATALTKCLLPACHPPPTGKVKDGVSDADASKAAADLVETIKDIPGIVSVSCSNSFTEKRSKGYSHCLVVRLDSAGALPVYAKHALHDKAKKESLIPVIDKAHGILAVDIESKRVPGPAAESTLLWKVATFASLGVAAVACGLVLHIRWVWGAGHVWIDGGDRSVGAT